MLASMASGRTRILNPLSSADCLATRAAFEQLGVRITETTDPCGGLIWLVDSKGPSSWNSPKIAIDLGNSGTSARLLTGLFAGIGGLEVTLVGDHSLERRPMARVVEPLRNMGAKISGFSPKSDENTLPLTITGSVLEPRSHVLQVPSAQVKSAIILAALSTRGSTQIDLPSGTRDHTEIMLSSLGANIRSSSYLGREKIAVVGPWVPQPFECHVPNDPSSVSFFAALAALHAGIKVTAERVLMNPRRTGFFSALGNMGLEVSWSKDLQKDDDLGEVSGSVSFYRPPGRPLLPLKIGGESAKAMIDEIPILGVVCAFADGVSEINGLAELRVKESDRLTMIQQLLQGAGVTCEVGGESLRISGRDRVTAFSFASEDHRLVMASMVLATKADKSSNIQGINWISTSFPLFLETFQNIRGMRAKT